MALTIVEITDGLDTQRTKINEISTNMGDLTQLLTPVTTNIVQAMNSLQTQIATGVTEDQMRDILLRAIALS